MGRINTDSGRPLLIRNCACGGKPELTNSRGMGDVEIRIICPKCHKTLNVFCIPRDKERLVRTLIQEWNRRTNNA